MKTIDVQDSIKDQLVAALNRALATGATHGAKEVAAAHSRHPAMSPTQVRRLLEQRYMATVVGSGLVAGGIAMTPPAGAPAAVLDAVAFVGLSVRLVLVEAALAGDPLDDEERLRTLALAAFVGNGAHKVLEQATKRTGAHLGIKATRAIPLETIRAVNAVLGRNFVTRFGTREGILVLGKAMPAGVGAIIGAGGNAALGAGVIKGAHVFCGPAVATWDELAVSLDVASTTGTKSPRARRDEGGPAPVFA